MVFSNVSKTKTVIISTQSKIKGLTNPAKLYSNGHYIDFAKEYDYFGAIIYSEISLLPLYKNTMEIVSNKIILLSKIRICFNYHTALCIYRLAIINNHLFIIQVFY